MSHRREGVIIAKRVRQKKKQSPVRRLLGRLFVFCLFVIGMLLFLYPFYINALNNFLDQQRLEIVQKQTEEENTARAKALAKKNAELAEQGINAGSVSFDTDGTDVSDAYYKEHLIGSISIPSINVDIPLFDTTNDSLLQLGATVVQGTSYPTGGANTHSVIAAHSGLPDRELFTNLENVKLGDEFVLTVLGEKLAYQVDKIIVVKPDETDSLKIEANRDLVTLLTCTPYMINTDRLLVTGHRVPYTEAIAKKVVKSKKTVNYKEAAILAGTVVAIILCLLFLARTIHAYLMKRKTMAIQVQVVDGAGQVKVGQAVTLFDRRGKKQLKRDGELFVRATDSTGTAIFTDLPRGVYRVALVEEQHPRQKAIVGMKKVKEAEVRLFKAIDDRVEKVADRIVITTQI
ncbi:MAG: class C sortase [Enterococcus italicus]|uniref:class C sortase n=1 Tax=Enterococcus italicus TaxID=246144 RepID=UPI0039958BBB